MVNKTDKLNTEGMEHISGLENLYDSESLTSDEDEIEYLYPISKMLKDVPEHYTDETFVKAGGEKRIFKVRDKLTDRVVALARPIESASDEQKERFLRKGG